MASLPRTSEGWQELADDVADAAFGRALRDPAALADAVRSLSEVYTKDREHLERARTRRALEARLRFYFLRDLHKPLVPLAELAFAGELTQPHWRVLDLGAGLGTTSCGVAQAAAERGASVEVEAVDADGAALALAERIFRTAGIRARTHVGDVTRPPVHGAFDLVVFGLVLNELPFAERVRAVTGAAERLGPNGAIVVLEPALKSVTRALHELRAELLSAGLHVFAPCLHEEPCPMLASPRDWCHESRPFAFGDELKKVARAAGLRFERITYAYLTLVTHGRSLRSALGGGARVVSERLVSKGKAELFVCDGSGHRRLGRLDRHRPKGNDPFGDARRGDVLFTDGAVPKGDGLRVVPETRVALRRPGRSGLPRSRDEGKRAR
ncbi:MAG: small ribosomal subunit Rsm22 family protein [Myxococcota bacterium]